MGGCQSQDARNAAIDANFPADSRHVMMKMSSERHQIGYKPRTEVKPRATSGMSALLEQKRAEQQQAADANVSGRTTVNLSDEEEKSSTPNSAIPDGAQRRRATEATSANDSDWSNSSHS